jgi:hypothetical protein
VGAIYWNCGTCHTVTCFNWITIGMFPQEQAVRNTFTKSVLGSDRNSWEISGKLFLTAMLAILRAPVPGLDLPSIY